MKALQVILIVALLVAGTFAEDAEEERLLQFNETHTEWVPVSVVEKLMTIPNVHFMDITDYNYDELPKAVEALPLPANPRYQNYVYGLLSSVSIGQVTTTIAALSGFFTRYYQSTTGVAAAQWLRQQYITHSGGRSDITVVDFTYTAFPQASVIATIPGTGPNKDNVVIIGGHLDSVGATHAGRSPGADDDASGSASILEAFRVLVAADYKPDFTLQFIGYAANEGGLLGSQGIAADYAQRNIPVYAVLQLDTTGYTGASGQSSVGIVTDYTSADLNAFVRKLVSTYTSLPQSNKLCGYACSDHASWNRTGFRSSFPSPNILNPNIHSANDLLVHLTLAQILEYAKLAVAFAVELAGIAN